MRPTSRSAALPIHDAVVVPKDAQGVAMGRMKQVFFDHTGAVANVTTEAA